MTIRYGCIICADEGLTAQEVGDRSDIPTWDARVGYVYEGTPFCLTCAKELHAGKHLETVGICSLCREWQSVETPYCYNDACCMNSIGPATEFPVVLD